MRAYALAFCAGLSCLNFFSVLPGFNLLLVTIATACMLSFYWRHFSYILVVLMGLSWGVYFSSQGLSNRIDSSLEGLPVAVDGRISGLPKNHGQIIQFDFLITCLRLLDSELSPDASPCVPAPHKIRLSWYGQAPEIIPGDLWHLKVKMKKGVGFVNPAGFDYEKWLFTRGISARGYVLNKLSYKHLPSSDPLWLDFIKNPKAYIDSLRNEIASRIDSLDISPLSRSFIKALTIGDKRGIAPAQHEVLAATGTSHLLAVSGLHVGLVAGFVYFILLYFCRYLLPQKWGFTAIKTATLGSLIIATLYCALAGFSLPTIRAWIMLLCFAQAILRDDYQSVWDSYFLALFFINLIQPFSVFETGFWLSFIAVAVILFVLTGRVQGFPASMPAVNWPWLSQIFQGLRASWQVQWAIFIGLLPFLLMYYGNIALLGPAFNFIAVPLMAWLVIPSALLGVVALFITPALALFFFKIASGGLQFFWLAAESVADISIFQISFQKPVAAVFIITLAASFLLLLPRKMSMRGYALFLSLPLLLSLFPQSKQGSFFSKIFNSEADLAHGEMEFTLLDVGQGLAAIIRTKTHLVIYDAGPPIGKVSDAGAAIITPYLEKSGLSTIDYLILSHNDIDHVGGAASLINRHKVNELGASEESITQLMSTVSAPLMAIKKVSPCNKPKHWSWDGINFLQFSVQHFNNQLNSRNNRSCLLKVWGEGFSVLLPGDIEKKAEIPLVAEFKRWVSREQLDYSLQSDILVAPHHGSKTSSSFTFLNAVKPQHVLFSAGYRSRFGHPHPTILNRYNQRGIEVFNTADSGALIYRFSRYKPAYTDGTLGREPRSVVHSLKPTEYRKAFPYFWRW